LLIVRHGQQERDGDDGPLTKLGREQARLTASAIELTEGDRLVSSTLRRAVQTATAFGREPEQVADLDEFRFGPSWVWEQADAGEDKALWRPDDRMRGGESLREFQFRVEAALATLIDSQGPGRLVVVVHSGVIDAIVRWVFGATPDTPWTTEVEAAQASITELRHWPTGQHADGAARHTHVVRLGDVNHLPAALITGA
jgi:probable phosphoglycerate mutase